MKNHISALGNLRLKYFVFALTFSFLSLLSACKTQDDTTPKLEYVTIPDENFEKALIQFKIDDVQDGKVLRTNVIKVTSLSISSSPENKNNTYDKIKDLTGIQEFVNLKSLKCVYGDLTSLDVSKNTALTELWCFSNKLTNLDVSKNLVLEKLRCGSNQLSIWM